MATSELAAKLAAMRKRMEEGESDDNVTKKQQTSLLGGNNGDAKDDTHCSAFGGGKPSAVAAAKKGGREFSSNKGVAAEPVDTELKSPVSTVKIEKEPVTPVSQSTPDTVLISVDVSFDADEEVVREVTPVNCPVDETSIVKKPPSPRKSHRTNQLHKAKKHVSISKTSLSEQNHPSTMPVGNMVVMDDSIDSFNTLSTPAEMEGRPLLTSQNEELLYESFQSSNKYSDDENDLTITDVDPIITSSTHQRQSPQKLVKSPRNRSKDRTDLHRKSYINELLLENESLREQLEFTNSLLLEKERTISYLTQLLHSDQNIKGEIHIDHGMKINEQFVSVPSGETGVMELKSSLKGNGTGMPKSRRFLC